MGRNIELHFPVIHEQTAEALEKQHARARPDYEEWKRAFLVWLATKGKRPASRDGLSRSTVRKTSHSVGAAMRWLWSERDTYTTQLSADDADRYTRFLAAHSGYSDSGIANHVKGLKRLFKYRNHEHGTDIGWSCPFQLSEPRVTNRDYFKQDEFRPLYEAALEHGTVKHYNSCSTAERDRLKGVLATRYDKSKDDVIPHDFERANSFKVPSLVGMALDMGLRPVEIERAKPSWVFPEKRLVRIPAEESSKNRDNWECVLSQRTARALSRWLSERQSYDAYATSDSLWLNAKRNPYTSKSLNYLLDQLVERAGISPAGRDLTWYSIRHGVATIWVEEEDVHDAREQLRHVRVKTTLGYSHSSTEKRLGAADAKY